MSLPLSGPETVSPAARPAAFLPSGPYPVLAVADARLLGLREGQIVRPTVEVRSERLVLLLDGRVVEWPGGAAPRAAAGLPPPVMAWTVRLLANGSAQLVPLRGREAGSAAPLPAAAGAPAEPARTAPAPGAALAPTAGMPARWAQLLGRPSPWTSWTAALRPGPTSGPAGISAPALPATATATATGLAPAPPGVASLLPMVGMALLDGVSLREAVRRSGLFAESRLARGDPVDLSDVKLALLARLRSADAAAGPASAAVSSALEDIEAAQVQSLAARADGGVVLQLALGFRDAPPLTMRLARDPEPEDREAAARDAGWTVDIHSRSDAWGPLWLQTRVASNGRIGLTMWAEREDVCDAARADASRLATLLREEGLQLERLQVVHGVRRDEPSAPGAGRAGVVLDLRV